MARDPAVRAVLALAAPLSAVAGAAAGALGADLAALRSADARFVAVTLGAAAPLAAWRIARAGSSPRARAALAILCAPMLLAAALPRQALAVSWLSCGTLVLLAEGAVHAARTALALTASRLRFALAAIAAVPCAYLAVAAFVVLFNTQLVVLPARFAHLRPAARPGERTMTIASEGGVHLGATYTPGARGAPGIVLAHGVADGRTRLLPWAERLSALGYHVLRFDFRAHGTSEGAVCTYGQREAYDVRAAVAALRAMPGVDRERIAVVGASMGGGAVLAASPWLVERRTRSIVLLAPASRYAPLVERRVAFLGPLAPPVLRASARLARAAGQAPMTHWAPAERLARAPDLPVLVVHGDRDATIPLALSRQLVREHARAELLVLPGVGHDELPHVAAHAPTWPRIEAFLARTLAR